MSYISYGPGVVPWSQNAGRGTDPHSRPGSGPNTAGTHSACLQCWAHFLVNNAGLDCGPPSLVRDYSPAEVQTERLVPEKKPTEATVKTHKAQITDPHSKSRTRTCFAPQQQVEIMPAKSRGQEHDISNKTLGPCSSCHHLNICAAE